MDGWIDDLWPQSFSDKASWVLDISVTEIRPTFWNIFKTKEVGQFTPAPYVLTVLNCSFWIIYGLPAVKNATLIISINTAGLVVEFCYVTIYMYYVAGTAKV